MHRRTFLAAGAATVAAGVTNALTGNAAQDVAAAHDKAGGHDNSKHNDLAKYDEFTKYDAVGLAALVRSRQVKPEELLDAAIARCEAVNPQLNAVVLKHYDEARADIRKGLPDGALRGVPFLITDETALANTETTFGSRLLAFRSTEDAELVARYRRAGLVMFGKTATPAGIAANTESLLYGVTRNPWSPGKCVGASSGGSCVAVAARIVPAAQAGDGGGSLRAPASLCGVVGLKPSRGMTPTSPFLPTLDVDHAATRTVRDCAALLDVIADSGAGGMFLVPPVKRPYLQEVGVSPGKLRIGFMTGYEGFDTHPDCVAAVRDAAALCEKLGHIVEEVKPPVDYRSLHESFAPLANVLIALLIRAKEHELGRSLTEPEIGTANWLAVEKGSQVNAMQYLQAEMAIPAVTAQMTNFFRSRDILLSPTVGTPPVDAEKVSPRHGPDGVTRILNTYGTFTVAGSYAGIPGISVPLYWNKDNLPVGTLFQAAHGQDGRLLRLAAQFEAARPWVQRYPKLG